MAYKHGIDLITHAESEHSGQTGKSFIGYWLVI